MPEILPGNKDAVDVYDIVGGQHIMGPTGPVELNLIPVYQTMDMLGVEDKKMTLRKVLTIYNTWIEQHRGN